MPRPTLFLRISATAGAAVPSVAGLSRARAASRATAEILRVSPSGATAETFDLSPSGNDRDLVGHDITPTGRPNQQRNTNSNGTVTGP